MKIAKCPPASEASGTTKVRGSFDTYPKMRFFTVQTNALSRQKKPYGHQGTSPHLFRRSQKRRLKRLLLSMIPFVLFIVGLTLVSAGLFSYIENESILAIFITSRDMSPSSGLHTLLRAGSSDSGITEPGETDTDRSTEPSAESGMTGIKEIAVSEPSARLIVPFYYYGDQIGVVRISAVNLEVNVYQGDTEDQIRLGAGHYDGSYYPGQDGNIVIAGHRTTYFRNLENLKTGDQVDFETTYGQFIYQVREIVILDSPDFDSIIEEAKEEQLTLYTCYPFIYIGNAPQRYVVRCNLVESELNT